MEPLLVLVAFCLEKPYGCWGKCILLVQVDKSCRIFLLKHEFSYSKNITQAEWETRGNVVNIQHFIACLCSRQSSPLTTTEWSASRQTRNDEEVTDWWRWWAIFLDKKGKKKLQSTSSKRKKDELLQDESTVTAPGLPSLPPPSVLEGEKKSVMWERATEWQRAGMVGDGWNNGVAARCDGGRWDATRPRCPACCAWFDSFTINPWDKNINILMPNKNVSPTRHKWEGHVLDAWMSWISQTKIKKDSI